jgi:Na+-translocating ferredoxin:NAD+ oxidoreductase subunit B
LVVDSRASLAARIEAALPQTQCRRCGYDDCRRYAEAVADGTAGINQCPPGGAEGVARLAALIGTAPLSLDPSRGLEGPLRTARIDEANCIGCTLCLAVCPVDCIVGGPKSLHTVIESLCTGCELCLPVCPVDCIGMHVVSGARTGWAAWSDAQATQARTRYAVHQRRALETEPVAESSGTARGGSLSTPALASSARSQPDELVAAALARVRRARHL